VAALPNPKALVEIEAVAVVGEVEKKIIQSADAPISSAPLSQAVQVKGFIKSADISAFSASWLIKSVDSPIPSAPPAPGQVVQVVLGKNQVMLPTPPDR
jgi:enamine deaminase RidA (YjgF/YER057c/UK114 family)